MNDTNKGYKQ